MTFVSTKAIYDLHQIQGSEARVQSLLRSWLWTFNADFVGVHAKDDGDAILFSYRNRVLTIPFDALKTEAWAKTLLMSRLDSAEVEYRMRQELELA